jgi:hypothetical protein
VSTTRLQNIRLVMADRQSGLRYSVDNSAANRRASSRDDQLSHASAAAEAFVDTQFPDLEGLPPGGDGAQLQLPLSTLQ